jgi:hypothetical protein
MEENYKSFHQVEGIVVVQVIIDNLFEEALGFRSPRSMEDKAPLRRNDTLLLSGMRATRSSSIRFTEPQGRIEEPPVPPRRST